MRRLTWVSLLCLPLAGLLGLWVAQAQTSSGAETSVLENSIHICERQVAGWRRQQQVELALVVLVAICGAVVSALHQTTAKWAKRTTLALGLTTSILTIVNSRVFTADDRTLGHAVFEGDSVISQLWVSLKAASDPTLPEEDRKTAMAEYSKKLAEFHAVGEKLNGTNPTAVAARQGTEFQVIPAANAQSQTAQMSQTALLPAWTQRPPVENDANFYFVGRAYDSSITVAKQNSMDDALHNALLTVRTRVPNVSGTALLDLIKASASVQDSAFVYDGKRGYVFYTLLRLSKETQTLAAGLPQAKAAAPLKFESKGWQPADLTANPTSGLFALDRQGGVSRLVAESPGAPQVEKLFRLKGNDAGDALTASADAVFVASSTKIGCTVYRYSLATKSLDSRLMAVGERCVGIANDGNAIYLSMPDRKQIRWWDNWQAKEAHSWDLSDAGLPGSMVYDEPGHRLIVADDAGSAYAVYLPEGRKQLVQSNLGAVQSIATSQFHILLASGPKILFLARSDGRGENPPADLQTLTGGHIVGVAVDKDDRVWFADYEKRLVEGPLPLI